MKDKTITVFYPHEAYVKLVRIQTALLDQKGFKPTLADLARESSILGMGDLCKEYNIEI